MVANNFLAKTKLMPHIKAINLIFVSLARHGLHKKVNLFLALFKSIKTKKDLIILKTSEITIQRTDGGVQILILLREGGLFLRKFVPLSGNHIFIFSNFSSNLLLHPLLGRPHGVLASLLHLLRNLGIKRFLPSGKGLFKTVLTGRHAAHLKPKTFNLGLQTSDFIIRGAGDKLALFKHGKHGFQKSATLSMVSHKLLQYISNRRRTDDGFTC